MANSLSNKSPRQSVEVNILGQRMLVKADDNPQHVQRLAAYVNRKVDEVSPLGPISSTKQAVLAALNIADDYFRALDEAAGFRQAVASKSRAILKDLER